MPSKVCEVVGAQELILAGESDGRRGTGGRWRAKPIGAGGGWERHRGVILGGVTVDGGLEKLSQGRNLFFLISAPAQLSAYANHEFKIIPTPTQLSAYANHKLKNRYYLAKVARRQTAWAKYWCRAYAQLERNITWTLINKLSLTLGVFPARCTFRFRAHLTLLLSSFFKNQLQIQYGFNWGSACRSSFARLT